MEIIELLHFICINPVKIVTKENIETLIPKVELFGNIAKRICEEKIREYAGHGK